MPQIIKNKNINLSKFYILIFFILTAIILLKVYDYCFFDSLEKPTYKMSFFNSDGQSIGETISGYRLVADPFAVYRNYPMQNNSNYQIDAKGFRVGYRNAEAKFSGFVMGSSAAFGYGVSDNNSTLVSHLTRAIHSYNFVNAAVVGYSSGQDLSQMIHYLDDYSPEIYVVINGWNDINTPARYTDDWPSKKIPLGFNSSYFEIEKRLERYSKILRPLKQATNFPPIVTNLDKEDYFELIVKEYQKNIKKMFAFASARNAKFLLVLQPEITKKIRTKEEEKMLHDWDAHFSYFEKEIPSRYEILAEKTRVFCRQQNIPYININDYSIFSENQSTLFIDVIHPNELGHKLIAEILSTHLSSKLDIQ